MSSVLDFDAIVRGLMAIGFDRPKAEAAAREQHPEVAASLDAAELRRADVLEKAEQRAVWKMALAVGCTGYWLSQARDSKQTPGLPDLWFTHAARSLAWWWETKKQVGGRRSRAQEEFAGECHCAGVRYGYGDRYDFAHFLYSLGITPPAIPTD